MKIIILSDVNSKSETIIPYGLRLARALEADVDVLHVIDKRLHQGEYTQASDSQSITPGSPLSQDEIINKEEGRANLKLDKVLSRETSRLNYPLRVKRLIRENSIEDELKLRAKENPNYLFVINAEPDNYMFNSKNDIISTVQTTGVMTLLVHPENKFKDYQRALLPTDFESKKFKAFTDINFLFEKFNMLVDAVSIVPKSEYSEKETKGGAWKQIVRDHFLPTTLKTNVLEGEDFPETVVAYIRRNKHDLILMFQKKENPLTTIFKKNDLDIILNKTPIPLLVYFHK